MALCSTHSACSSDLRRIHTMPPLPSVAAAPDSSMSGLPLELWRLVFSYLSVADLCSCAQVCRSWIVLVASLDKTTWRTHFLACREWRHPEWPKNTETEVPSWQQAYRQHYLASRLWLKCASGLDHANCMTLLLPRYERRSIHVGPNGDYVTLKRALAAASAFDRILLAPGLYDEQFEVLSKIPFELIGDGEPGSVILLTSVEQTALTGRLCNLTLTAPWYTSYVIKVVQGHLQVDHCLLQDGQVWVQSPGTLHMRYCTLEHTQAAFHTTPVSIIENCLFQKADSCAVSVEGQPKLNQNNLHQHLLKAADTYNLRVHMISENSDDTLERPPSSALSGQLEDDEESLQDSPTGPGSPTGNHGDTGHEDGYNSSSTDLSSSDNSSDYGSPGESQPWLGQACVAWSDDAKEPPLQWDTDPIPAFTQFLRSDDACREALADIHGVVIRRCKINQCHGGVSVGRGAQGHIELCDMMDLQYGVRCLQNTKVAILENTIHHCSSSAIFMRMGATGIIAGNDIYYTAEAGIDVRKYADPLIQHNRLHHSKRSGVVVLGRGRGTIKANDIYQNREAGIYILYKGDPYVSGNRICHGAASGIAVTENGKGYIVDNMISGNRWGGIDIRRGGAPCVTRNLICNGWADGIVIGSRGKGTIEANCIRGNSGCGIWVMSGHPLIQSNQIYNNKDNGVLMVTKEGEPDTGDSADEESDSDMGDYSTIAAPLSDTSSAFSSTPNYQLNVKYNSIYRNSGSGVVCQISESVLLQANAIHANRSSGVAVRQVMPVLLQRNSITCNVGHGVEASGQAKIQVSGSGIYDNLGHGVNVEGEAAITHTDILCNQLSAVCATAQGQLQIDNSRLYAGNDPAVLLDGSSRGEVSSCIIYRGQQEESVQHRDHAVCSQTNNTISNSHLQSSCLPSDDDGSENDNTDRRPELIYRRGFDWKIKDPPPRPPRELPPRVEILETPTIRLGPPIKVGVPWGGGCHLAGSKTCCLL